MEITTKGGHKVELKKELTGGEYQDIQDVMFSASKMNGESVDVSGSVITEMLNKAIVTIVVSVDDKKENILELVRALPVSDYNEIIESVNGIKDGLDDEKKTT